MALQTMCVVTKNNGDPNLALNAWPRDQNVREVSTQQRHNWVKLDIWCAPA